MHNDDNKLRKIEKNINRDLRQGNIIISLISV